MGRLRWCAWLWLAVLLASCTHPQAAEVIVEVDSDLAALHTVTIEIRDDARPSGARVLFSQQVVVDGTDASARLPLVVPVVLDDGSAGHTLQISATADDTVLGTISQNANVMSVAHTVLGVRLFLATACRDAALRAQCETQGMVCGVSGACEAVPVTMLDPNDGGVITASGRDASATDIVVAPDAADVVDASDARDASVVADVVDAADARDASDANDVVDAAVADVTDAQVVVMADVVDASETRDAAVDATDRGDAIDAVDVLDAADTIDARDAVADVEAATCPSGQIGTPPNCMLPSDPCAANGGCDPLTTCTVTGATTHTCSACPVGYTGTGATACTWNDPALTTLVPSTGALSPAFTGATTGYEMTVTLSTASLGLRPGVAMPDAATITVDGVTVPSGQSSVARALALGDTVLSVVVTAAGGATRTYTVTVHRAVSILQRAYIKASNPGADDHFGVVAISGDTLAVGTGGEDGGSRGINGDQSSETATDSGAVYVFVRTGGVWSQQAYIKAGNAAAYDNFGWSVALSGDTLAVGAIFQDGAGRGINPTAAGSAPDSGAVYVFTRTGTTWSQQAYIKTGNADANDHFGVSVALAGDMLVAGAQWEGGGVAGIDGNPDDNGVTHAGAVYVFSRTGATWTQQHYLKASNPGANDRFGAMLSLSGTTLLVGARGEASNATGVNGNQANNSATDSGAAYVFVETGGTWSQQAYLKASNTDASDFFGAYGAISGDTIAVGAGYEASSATGIDGDPSNNSAPYSGAVYVFARAGTTWTQQAYMKASNTGVNDGFGTNLAILGDTLVVAAPYEASSATGVGGNQSDNGANASGAVYLFTRAGSTWTQRAYFKASNTGANAFFGSIVTLSSDTLVVAAVGESSNASGVGGDQNDDSLAGSGAVYAFSY